MKNISVVELLTEIEKRPAMYLGRKSLSLLAAFLHGLYIFDENITDGAVLPKFQKWIQKGYKIKTTHHWSNIILFYQGDEHYAFDKFFELFKEFMDTKPLG